jgi:excisionase family DNA binding protein
VCDLMRTAEDLVSGGLVTVSEAQRFSGLGRTSIYALMTSGQLPSLKIGGSRRIPRQALIALAARSLIAQADDQGKHA